MTELKGIKIQKIKGYINYSKFGNTVSLEPRCHEEIFDEIEIYVPDKYKISYTINDEILININNVDWLLNDIIYITKDNEIYIHNMKYPETNYSIKLKYKNLG